jgi:hypothetical protein
MASESKSMSRLLARNLLTLLAIQMFASASMAQAEDTLTPIQAFWSNKLPDTTQLKNSYNNLHTTPFGREDLGFSLLVPSNWKDTQVTVKPEQLEQDSQNWIPLTLQVAPGEEKGEAVIQVAYIRLDLEMNLCDYVDQHLEANNYDVLMRRDGVYNQRSVDEVLVKSNNQLARLTFSRHGDRIYVVSCSSPESEFNSHAQTFAAASISFTVDKDSPETFANPMTTFTSGKAPKLEFRYPEDWELEEARDQPSGQAGVEIRIAAPDEKGQMMTYGYIYVQGYANSSGETPGQALADMKEVLQNKPLAFQERTLKVDLDPMKEDPLSKLERWTAAVKGAPAEVAVLIVPRGSDVLALSLVVPRREDNLLAWMHCWRIFGIVVDDLVGGEVPIERVKNLTLPSGSELTALARSTMIDFSEAVQKNDFSRFFNETSRLFQVQSSPGRLRAAFGGFTKQKEIGLLNQHDPVLPTDCLINSDGLLEMEGYFPTTPKATTFKLTYLYEKPLWRLLGINVAMSTDLLKPQ